MNIANRLTDVAMLIRYGYIPTQNDSYLYSPLYFVQVYDLGINRVIVNGSKGCGILGINILGNSSLVYSSFAGNMFNAFFVYTRTLPGIARLLLQISFLFWQLSTLTSSLESQN